MKQEESQEQSIKQSFIAALLFFSLVANLFFLYIIKIQDNEIDTINAKECPTVYEPVYIDQWGNAYDFVKEK